MNFHSNLCMFCMWCAMKYIQNSKTTDYRSLLDALHVLKLRERKKTIKMDRARVREWERDREKKVLFLKIIFNFQFRTFLFDTKNHSMDFNLTLPFNDIQWLLPSKIRINVWCALYMVHSYLMCMTSIDYYARNFSAQFLAWMCVECMVWVWICVTVYYMTIIAGLLIHETWDRREI